jgi:hypothetical protein
MTVAPHNSHKPAIALVKQKIINSRLYPNPYCVDLESLWVPNRLYETPKDSVDAAARRLSGSEL